MEAKRSDCPIAAALDVFGDRWTLLLVRDIGLFGKHRNKDFQDGAEGIPSNILADRLRRLVATGLVVRRRYQAHPPRYEYHLTEAGAALLPILEAMALWAKDHIAGVRLPPLPGD
ncbi:MAG: helix-turn-helix transcriptional regulator [Rhodocyclaceae bacterium]|nr:helix-turn-helix transcriptional regulator [Rhodocyclaceae bacterium]